MSTVIIFFLNEKSTLTGPNEVSSAVYLVVTPLFRRLSRVFIFLLFLHKRLNVFLEMTMFDGISYSVIR
jgi:hypothetical protein